MTSKNQSLKNIIHFVVVFIFCGLFLRYAYLIRHELQIGNTDDTVRIVASQPQQYINSIQLNGHYFKESETVKNDWYIVENDVLETFYISQAPENTMEFKSEAPIHSIGFEYQVSETPGTIDVYVGDALVKTVDLSEGDQAKELVFIQQPGRAAVNKDNLVWYISLAVLALGLVAFALTYATWAIKIKQLLVLSVLLLLQNLSIAYAFPHFYREKVAFFNSELTHTELIQVLLCFSFLLFAGGIGYQQLKKNKWVSSIQTPVTTLSYLLLPFVSLFIIQDTYAQFGALSTDSVIQNVWLISMFYVLLSLMTSFKAASILLAMGSLVLGIGNHVMIESRGLPLLFYNLFQIKDGLNVASNVAISLNNRILISLSLTHLWIAYLTFLPSLDWTALRQSKYTAFIYEHKWAKRIKEVKFPLSKTLLFRGSRLLIGYIALLIFLPLASQTIVQKANIPLNFWRMVSTYGRYGLPLSLASFYENSKIAKPDGYSPTRLTNLSQQYPPEKTTSTTKPNIVIIQNESQVDFSNLKGLVMTPDPLGNQHALTKDAIHGRLNVSVFGGGTANTEYEVLTSNSISSLSSNLFPYQQIISQERPSFATYLKQQEYDTVAMHPQAGNNYNRKTVYPLLGFDQSYFLDSKPEIASLAKLSMDRNWPSDRFLFNSIQKLYETKGDKPLFSFVVTMQGHGGYPTSEQHYQREVSINGSTSEFLPETEFLTSMKKSDEAFADLIAFFRSYKEPTIVVMYGDHQPSLTKEFYAKFMDEKDPSAKYSTPIVIWANFNIKERPSTTISPNYLVPYLMDILSESNYPLPKTTYQQFLEELQAEVPIMTGWGNIGPDGQTIPDIHSLPLYQTYLQLEYNNAIEKHPLHSLFEAP